MANHDDASEVKQPTDYVDADERIPKAERRPDHTGLVCVYLFALAGLLVGWTACFLWMTGGRG